MSKRVSIIIPVYNQEVLLKRALDSIPARDDIEVICIDDCSTDKSYEILTNYKRIPLKVFKTPVNSGPGVTRNIGYDNATGEFVYGLDSDDALDTKEFVKLLESDVLNRFDLLHVPIRVNSGQTWNNRGDCNAVHTYLVRRTLIGDLRMPTVRRGEDYLFLKSLLKKNPKQGQYRKAVYLYNYPRESSITWDWEHHLVTDWGEKL